MTIYNVDPTDLIEELAKELKKAESIKPPEWASFAKTGASRERPPARQDWWHIRAASVLRKVMLKGPIGVSKLRILYGGLKNKGHAPERFKKSSGNILRKILQQLEKEELVKKGEKSKHKGRIITPKGIKLINNVAKKISGKKPVEVKKEEKPKTTESKTEELVKKTKEFAQGKTPTAEKLIEETKKEVKEEKKVPTAAELAEKQNG
jgi:small subunit ribosomal protein S19e